MRVVVSLSAVLMQIQWFRETVYKFDLFPAGVYCDSYSVRYFVEEMQMQDFTTTHRVRGHNPVLAYTSAVHYKGVLLI